MDNSFVDNLYENIVPKIINKFKINMLQVVDKIISNNIIFNDNIEQINLNINAIYFSKKNIIKYFLNIKN
jgi:hypothetical protein